MSSRVHKAEPTYMANRHDVEGSPKGSPTGAHAITWTKRAPQTTAHGVTLPSCVPVSNSSKEGCPGFVIDLSLPVSAPAEPLEVLSDYKGMTPRQRLGYLTWLSGWRERKPNRAYLSLWLKGLEHCVINDLSRSGMEPVQVLSLLEGLADICVEWEDVYESACGLADIVAIEYIPEALPQRLLLSKSPRSLAANYAISRFFDDDPALQAHALYQSEYLEFPSLGLDEYPFFYCKLREALLRQPAHGPGRIMHFNAEDIQYSPVGSNQAGCSSYSRPRTGKSTHLEIDVDRVELAHQSALALTNDVFTDAYNGKFRAFAKIALGWPSDIAHRMPEAAKGYLSFCRSVLCDDRPVRTTELAGMLGESCASALTETDILLLTELLRHLRVRVSPDPGRYWKDIAGSESVYVISHPSNIQLPKRVVFHELYISAANWLSFNSGNRDEIRDRLEVSIRAIPLTDERRYLSEFLRWNGANPLSPQNTAVLISRLHSSDRELLARQLLATFRVSSNSSLEFLGKILDGLAGLGLGSSFAYKKLEAFERAASAPKHESRQSPTGEIISESEAKVFDDQMPIPGLEATQEGILTDSCLWYDGFLSPSLGSLVNLLCTRSKWERPDFEYFCSEQNLTARATVRTINKASKHVFGEPLLRSSGAIRLNRKVLARIEAYSDKSTPISQAT